VGAGVVSKDILIGLDKVDLDIWQVDLLDKVEPADQGIGSGRSYLCMVRNTPTNYMWVPLQPLGPYVHFLIDLAKLCWTIRGTNR
jgi:hypothetical protein